jgi:hypothetical protein
MPLYIPGFFITEGFSLFLDFRLSQDSSLTTHDLCSSQDLSLFAEFTAAQEAAATQDSVNPMIHLGSQDLSLKRDSSPTQDSYVGCPSRVGGFGPSGPDPDTTVEDRLNPDPIMHYLINKNDFS